MMSMTVRRTSALLLRQYYLLRGSVARLVPLFVWVGVDMVLWGFITRYLNTFTASAHNFVPAMLGAVLLWDFFIRIMQGITMAFFEDVWARNFLNLFATPIEVSEYLGGLVLSSIATSCVGMLVMLALAGLFGFSFLVYGAMLAPFVLVLFLVGIALGIFAVALVLRLGPAAEWFIWPIPAVLSPFAGVFYPLATLPPWMRAISYLLPHSYIFESMRAILRGQPVSIPSLLIGASMAVLYVLLACWFFKKTFQRAVRTGLIARYSAETVN